jgi:hypothetical protein
MRASSIDADSFGSVHASSVRLAGRAQSKGSDLSWKLQLPVPISAAEPHESRRWKGYVMCNAANHSWACDCGFGGDTGGGGGWRARAVSVATLECVSVGWAKDSRGTVESYVNPNAHCPVCGEAVYFYRSPFNGRVFFDDLGWPWPKHGCTDTSREPRRASRDSLGSAPRPEPAWRVEGWHPLLSSRVYSGGGRHRITGDFHDEFLELDLPEHEAIDSNSPILVREQIGKPDLFEVTFVRSNRFGTERRKTIGFRSRIAGAGAETILRVAQKDAAANSEVGRFLLWRLTIRPRRDLIWSKRSRAASTMRSLTWRS